MERKLPSLEQLILKPNRVTQGEIKDSVGSQEDIGEEGNQPMSSS